MAVRWCCVIGSGLSLLIRLKIEIFRVDVLANDGLAHRLCVKEVVTMDTMRTMDMKVVAWVRRWEDAVEEATGLVMGPRPLLLGSMGATPSLLSSCCTAWTPRRWTQIASLISSASMATWRGLVSSRSSEADLNIPSSARNMVFFDVWTVFLSPQVKFMKSKPGAAMVEMGDCYAVDRAITHLNNTYLFGQKINVW